MVSLKNSIKIKVAGLTSFLFHMFYFLFKTCYLYYPQCNLHSIYSHNRLHTCIHCNLCSTSFHFFSSDPSVCLLIQLSFHFLCFWVVVPVKIIQSTSWILPRISWLSSSETSFFCPSGSYQTIYAFIHVFFALDIYQCSECFASNNHHSFIVSSFYVIHVYILTLLQPSPCISTSKCVKWRFFHQHSVVSLLLVCLKKIDLFILSSNLNKTSQAQHQGNVQRGMINWG